MKFGIVERWRNLAAVPSVHFHPTFARAVRSAVSAFRPTVIAVEISEEWQPTTRWALTQWPRPVAAVSASGFWPFVPGDSILEAVRIADAKSIELRCVDAEVADSGPRAWAPPWIDPVFAEHAGRTFREVRDAASASAGPPLDSDLEREAHMAASLLDLMRSFDRVLWVGGLAHWSRLRDRLVREDAHVVSSKRLGEIRVARMDPTAILACTMRLPWMVGRYGRSPGRYNERIALRSLALRAARLTRSAIGDVIPMLRFARNLAASRAIAETPSLFDLVDASLGCVGPEYAAALLALSFDYGDKPTAVPATLPRLWFGAGGVDDTLREGYWLDDEPIDVHPVPDMSGRRLLRVPSLEGLRARTEPDRVYKEVGTAKEGDNRRWIGDPDDDRAYEAYISYVLERLPRSEPEEHSAPFVSGFADGLDVRGTVRHLSDPDATIYVREITRRPSIIRNGLIDYTSRREGTAVHRNATGPKSQPGWSDTDLLHAGSASREVDAPAVVQQSPFYVGTHRRELSLITLDAFNSGGAGSKRFHPPVIANLVRLTRADDNLYGWLRVMFAFCAGKPFAYYAHYRPGRRVLQLAKEFDVAVHAMPLCRIPSALRARHSEVRFLCLTREQWREYLLRKHLLHDPMAEGAELAKDLRESFDRASPRGGAPPL